MATIFGDAAFAELFHKLFCSEDWLQVRVRQQAALGAACMQCSPAASLLLPAVVKAFAREGARALQCRRRNPFHACGGGFTSLYSQVMQSTAWNSACRCRGRPRPASSRRWATTLTTSAASSSRPGSSGARAALGPRIRHVALHVGTALPAWAVCMPCTSHPSRTVIDPDDNSCAHGPVLLRLLVIM